MLTDTASNTISRNNVTVECRDAPLLARSPHRGFDSCLYRYPNGAFLAVVGPAGGSSRPRLCKLGSIPKSTYMWY